MLTRHFPGGLRGGHSLGQGDIFQNGQTGEQGLEGGNKGQPPPPGIEGLMGESKQISAPVENPARGRAAQGRGQPQQNIGFLGGHPLQQDEFLETDGQGNRTGTRVG